MMRDSNFAKAAFGFGMTALSLTQIPVAFAAPDGVIEQMAAATPDQVAAAGSDKGLEEVVVTAEKRRENLQVTPVTVTALGADALTASGVVNVTDLSGLAPGLVVNESLGGGRTISIRGLGNEAPQGAALSAVAVHLDGVYLPSASSLNGEFLDLDRIEVLRGPQGPVHGQNSTGGAVNIISKVPTLGDESGNVDLSYGTYNLVRFNGALDLPVTDTLAVRAAVLTNRHDGFAHALNVPGQPNYPLDDDNSVTARLSILWQPTDNFSILGRSYYYDLAANAREQKNINDPLKDPRETSSDYGTRLGNRTEINSLTAKWDFGLGELTSITGWQYIKRSYPVNNDGLDFALAAIYNPYPGYGHDLVVDQSGSEQVFTQEVDVASEPNSGKLSWLAGGFYEYYLQKGRFLEYQVPNASIPIINAYDPNVLKYINNGFEALTAGYREAWSTYGQATYDVLDWADITLGARYNHDETSSHNSVYFSPPGKPYGPTANAVTGKAGLNVKLTPENLIYFSYSTGFEPGGNNIVPGGVSGALVVKPSFGPEKNKAIEIGTKNEFFDHKVRVNVSAFHYAYSNLQIYAEDPVPFNGGTDSIPKATIEGAEGEFSVILPYNLRLDMSAALERGTIDSDYFTLDPVKAEQIVVAGSKLGLGAFSPQTIAARAAAVQNVKGNSVPKLPHISGTVSLLHVLDLGDLGSLTSRASVDFHSGYNYRVLANANTDRVPGSAITNLDFTYEPVRGAWSVGLQILNMFDRAALTTRNTDSFGVGATFEQFVPPLQVIGKISYKF